MRNCKLLLWAAGWTALAGAPVQATVVDFEDALTPPVVFDTLSNYEGFDWSDGAGGTYADILVVDVPAFGGSLQPGFGPGLISGAIVATKAAGSSPDGLLATSRILSAAGFMLESGYFTAASGTQTLTFDGYKAGVPVYTATQSINATASTLVTFSGWLDLDELRITSDAPAISWILDDLSVAAPIPEPSTWALLSVGLGLLVAAARGRIARA